MISETIISTDNEKYGKVFWCFQPASQLCIHLYYIPYNIYYRGKVYKTTSTVVDPVGLSGRSHVKYTWP